MVPVAVDELVELVVGPVLAVEAAKLVVEAVLAGQDEDERSGPIAGPIRRATLKLDRSGSKRAHFNPLFQSMISKHSSGDVDGLVVLEIGRKDVAQEAQLIIDAILDHAALVLRTLPCWPTLSFLSMLRSGC